MKSLSLDLIYYFDALLSDKKLKKQAWGGMVAQDNFENL